MEELRLISEIEIGKRGAGHLAVECVIARRVGIIVGINARALEARAEVDIVRPPKLNCLATVFEGGGILAQCAARENIDKARDVEADARENGNPRSKRNLLAEALQSLQSWIFRNLGSRVTARSGVKRRGKSWVEDVRFV